MSVKGKERMESPQVGISERTRIKKSWEIKIERKRDRERKSHQQRARDETRRSKGRRVLLLFLSSTRDSGQSVGLGGTRNTTKNAMEHFSFREQK